MRRFTAFALASLLAVTACGGGAGDAVEGSLQSELAAGLLTEAEVQDAPGAPGGLRRATDGSIGVTQDPDPRGPCGAVVDAIPFDAGAVAVFGRPDIVIVQVVLVDTGSLAADAIADNRADFVPGCPAYTKSTQFGDPQRTELVRRVDLPAVGDDAFAFLIRGAVGDAAPVYGLQVLVRRDTDLSALLLFSSEPLEDTFVQDLAARAASRLEAIGR